MQNTSSSTYTAGHYVRLASALGQRRIRPVVMVASTVFALLYFLTLQLNKTFIAQDLSSRAMAIISNPNIQIDFEGRDGVIKGTVATIQDVGQVLSKVQGVWGVRSLDNQMTVQKVSVENLNKANVAYPLLSSGQLILSDLGFASNSATLNPAIEKRLDDIFNVMKSLQGMRFQISGHTDDTGTEAKNLSLSLQRALSVKTYFIAKGLPERRLLVQGLGSSQPLADNRTERGRSQNRRIEISQIKPDMVTQGEK